MGDLCMSTPLISVPPSPPPPFEKYLALMGCFFLTISPRFGTCREEYANDFLILTTKKQICYLMNISKQKYNLIPI